MPTITQKDKYNNPSFKEPIDNIFFKGTAGEEVTFVQKIEPKSVKSTICETVELLATDVNEERPETVSPSRPGPSTGHHRQTPKEIKLEKIVIKTRTAKKTEHTRLRKIYCDAQCMDDSPIDVVDISDDVEQLEVAPTPPPNQKQRSDDDDIVTDSGNIDDDVVTDSGNIDDDVVTDSGNLDNVDQEQQGHGEANPDPVSPSLLISQESVEVEDFPFPDLLQPLPNRSSSPVSLEIPEVILYDDTDQDTGDEAENFIPVVNVDDERMSPDIFAAVDGESDEPPFAAGDAEVMETDGDTTAEEVTTKRKRNASDSASSTHSESLQLIEQEVENLCKSSQSQEAIGAQAESMEVAEDDSPDAAVAGSSRTNARLLSQIPTVPRFPSQAKVLSQDVMVDSESQLFNDIEDLVSQEMNFNDEVPESPRDPPEVRDERNNERNAPLKHNSGTDSDSISSDDSGATALVTNKTSMKQLFELKGISKFHLLCKVKLLIWTLECRALLMLFILTYYVSIHFTIQIHEFHEIPEKKQVILRVSDGTHIRFATRKGFPVAPGADVTLTLQVDILVSI